MQGGYKYLWCCRKYTMLFLLLSAGSNVLHRGRTSCPWKHAEYHTVRWIKQDLGITEPKLIQPSLGFQKQPGFHCWHLPERSEQYFHGLKLLCTGTHYHNARDTSTTADSKCIDNGLLLEWLISSHHCSCNEPISHTSDEKLVLPS